MSHMSVPIRKIIPVFEYEEIPQHTDASDTTSTYSPSWDIFKFFLHLMLGYGYLSLLYYFEVHKIVTGTLIYPIVLLNYAGAEVSKSLLSQIYPTRIKFVLMMLSAEILILSLVVWHDLFWN